MSGKGDTKNVSAEEHEAARKAAQARKRRGSGNKDRQGGETLLSGIQQDKSERHEAARQHRLRPVYFYAVELLEEFATRTFKRKNTDDEFKRWTQAVLEQAKLLMEYYFIGDEDLLEEVNLTFEVQDQVQRFYMLACEVLKADDRDTYKRQDWFDSEVLRKEILPFAGYARHVRYTERAAKAKLHQEEAEEAAS